MQLVQVQDQAQVQVQVQTQQQPPDVPENQQELHAYRTQLRGEPAPPQVRGPQDPSQFGGRGPPVTNEECVAWFDANSFEQVTFKSVRENLQVLGKYVATLDQPEEFKIRNNPHQCSGRNAMVSAMRLLPHVQVMQDFHKAMSGAVGERAVAPSSKKHVLPGTQIEVFEWQIEAKPVDYGWLRDTIGMCASEYLSLIHISEPTRPY